MGSLIPNISSLSFEGTQLHLLRLSSTLPGSLCTEPSNSPVTYCNPLGDVYEQLMGTWLSSVGGPPIPDSHLGVVSQV